MDKKGSEHDTNLIKAFLSNHNLCFGFASFRQNWYDVKRLIAENDKKSITILEGIKDYPFKNRYSLDYLQSDLTVIVDDAERDIF